MTDWTEEQKQAIYEKDSNLLVAAAAGSGKTAVLVERIINKVIKENIDINKLLVVTFTNAAASEMKERVLDAIYEKLEKDPDNENLQKQVSLLNIANICTIDSFCLEVVRNNFFEIENLSPNFRIADTAEIELLKQEILDELFEKKYLADDKDFIELINTYTSYKDDSPLKELILNIYNYVSSSPYPLKWLDEKIEQFNIKDELDGNFSNTTWGKILIEEIKEEIKDDITILEDLVQSLSFDEQLEPWKNVVESDIKLIRTLENNLENWDKAFEIADGIRKRKIIFTTWPTKKVESEIKDEAKEIRNSVRDKFKKKIAKIFVSDSMQSYKDIYDMYKILKKLENLIIEFDNDFSKKKRDKNLVDFTDIEHFALDILIKDIDENGKIIKSDVAQKYTEEFEEIAIDEYQDSNLVQEYILSSISRDNNMFMVGDVKQSIYRFRQAMPKLFLDKYEDFEDIKEVDSSYKKNQGRKIKLFKNFRSRDNVLNFTNLIFKNIMSSSLGEIEYTKEEYLNCGAKDYEKNSQNLETEIDIIDINKQDGLEELEIDTNNNQENSDENYKDEVEHIENIELEAKYIAEKIKTLIESKYQIFDRKNKKFRDIKYKDIAILLRSTKDKANIYEREILNLDMPVFTDTNQQYLDAIEIQTIISLLKVIDNPTQDIPLVTVLRSTIGNFSDNELVEIRLSDKNENFYKCMQKAKIDVEPKLKEKIEKFLYNIDMWRKEQEYLALDELIWKIYSDTGYYNYVGLMPNGELRQANLRILFERAKKYETSSFKGLYNFINFIEKLKTNSGDLGSAKLIGENEDVIRIMSIHKSKGLEFPIVFLANANKKFNEQDIRQSSVLMHQEIGIGVKYINYNAQIKYDTLTREAIKNIILNENISEEMRVLYVALTRAKEKLFITGTVSNIEEKLDKLKTKSKIYKRKNEKINPILIKKSKSYLEWLLLVYIYEKQNIDNLFEIKYIKPRDILKNKIEKNNDVIGEINKENIINILDSKKIKVEDSDKVKDNITYQYEYKLETSIPTKTSVTNIKQTKEERKEESKDKNENKNNDKNKETNINENKNIALFEVPNFLDKNTEIKLTSAQKGTIVHLCMQKLNHKEEYDLNKIKQLLDEMEFKKIISGREKNEVNPYKILSFTKSKIWKELKTAKEIYKEKPFYIEIPSKEIFNKELDGNILVQGIIDLYYIDKNDNLVLLDYKTDFIQEGEEHKLIEKYRTQLEIYKDALEKALNRKVDKVYIYSVYLEKEIELT